MPDATRTAAPAQRARYDDARRLPGRRPVRQRLSLVRPDDAGERGGARAQCRRHRGADRGRLAHQRRARTAGRRPRPAPAHHRRQSDHPTRARFRGWCPSIGAGSTAASISIIPPPTPSATPSRRGAGSRPADFQSLIVVTSNFHMPRAMAELGHQLPGRGAGALSRWCPTRSGSRPGGKIRRPRGSYFWNI